MTYQELLKKNMKRSYTKFLVLYSVLALICLGGALSGLTTQSTVEVLNLLPLSSHVTGTIFLALFILMLILIVRTLRAAWSGKAYREVYESVQKFGSPEKIFDYIGQLPKSSLCSHGDFRCDRKYMAFLLDDSFVIRPTHHIVWGYLEEEAKAASRRNRTFTVQTSEPPVVTLLLEDNRAIRLRARNKSAAEQLLASIKEVNPPMSVGFTEKNVNIYRSNPKNLRSSSNIPREEASQPAGKKSH